MARCLSVGLIFQNLKKERHEGNLEEDAFFVLRVNGQHLAFTHRMEDKMRKVKEQDCRKEKKKKESGCSMNEIKFRIYRN